MTLKPIQSTGQILTLDQREQTAVPHLDARLDHLAHVLLTLGHYAAARLVEEARVALGTGKLPE